MIKLKELKEFHSKEKSLNMKKLPELKEFLLKEQSLIIMQLKLKLNTFLNKLNKLLLNMNQLKELGKESNIFQLKLKLFTTQNETTTLLNKEKLFKVDIQLLQLIKLELHMSQLKVELELKPSTKLAMSQLHHKLFTDKPNTLLEDKLNMLQEDNQDIQLDNKSDILLDKPDILLDKHTLLDPLMLLEVKLPMLLEDQELEDKQFTNNPKLEVMLLVEVELDNIEIDLL